MGKEFLIYVLSILYLSIKSRFKSENSEQEETRQETHITQRKNPFQSASLIVSDLITGNCLYIFKLFSV